MNKKQRTRRSQFCCPRCGKHQIIVRDTVPKGGRIIERYRFCEACHYVFKTQERVVKNYSSKNK